MVPGARVQSPGEPTPCTRRAPETPRGNLRERTQAEGDGLLADQSILRQACETPRSTALRPGRTLFLLRPARSEVGRQHRAPRRGLPRWRGPRRELCRLLQAPQLVVRAHVPEGEAPDRPEPKGHFHLSRCQGGETEADLDAIVQSLEEGHIISLTDGKVTYHPPLAAR